MSIEINSSDGSLIIIHDHDKAPEIMGCLRKFDSERRTFHEKLMSQDVKAYRCNDGWVDRENHNITFFSNERQYGYYWGNLNLKKGDKIFIGDAHDYGKFAIIEDVLSHNLHSAKYHYKLIEDPIKVKKKWSIKNIFNIKQWKDEQANNNNN